MKLDNDTREALVTLIINRIDFLIKKKKEVKEETVDRIISFELENQEDEFDDEDIKKIKRDVEYYAQIKHTDDTVIFEDYDDHDWYENQNGEFWTLYRRYLEQTGSLDRNSINKLEQDTLPNLMNCLGNPNGQIKKKLRRGLVIGDVQSGKTATYTGLICKAADAGYKVVILLTGITETLRKQTQERMEEGIIGYTIRRVTRGTKKARQTDVVGVGKYEHTLTATAFTSYEDDFRADANTIATSLKSHKSLVMFIVKKNVRILENLFNWLEAFNKDVLDDMIHAPMLLIDDEADNASVNTNKDKYNPTRTNNIIRKLCNAFSNATYVGFTATPFANVFIDPDTTSEMVNADLFPQDFIYVLPTPSTYIGADKLFNPDEPLYEKCLKFIRDITEPTKEDLADDPDPDERPLYYKHSKNWHGTFPDSFIDSIHCFYLANVIRDLRGDITKPRTMMINVSRFVNVHKYIVEYVKDIYDTDYGIIKTDFDDNFSNNSNLELFVSLKQLYDKHYQNCGFPIEKVLDKQNLLKAIEHIMVLKVNSKKGSDKLDYKAHPNLRAIAVGGLSLSRGLTLNGLVTSYFYRNTSTFDVLMQMGRWFGYRPNYADLCQIWTSETSAVWYGQISESTEELKEDIRRMREDKMTPKEFGIKVHDISEDLQITSPNKMRNSYNHDEYLDFWGNLFETPYVSLKAENNKINLEIVKGLFAKIAEDGSIFSQPYQEDTTGTVIFKDVPRVYTNSLLNQIKVSLRNIHFYMSEMRDFLNDTSDPKLNLWDIVVFAGNSQEEPYAINSNNRIKLMERTIKLMGNDSSGKYIGFTGKSGRLGSKTDSLYALEYNNEEEKCKKIEEALKLYMIENELDIKPKMQDVQGNTWFKYIADRNPCLMIYLVRPTEKAKNVESKEMKKFLSEIGDSPIVGFGVGYPRLDGSSKAPKKYKINKTYLRLLMEESGEDDELS